MHCRRAGLFFRSATPSVAGPRGARDQLVSTRLFSATLDFPKSLKTRRVKIDPMRTVALASMTCAVHTILGSSQRFRLRPDYLAASERYRCGVESSCMSCYV